MLDEACDQLGLLHQVAWRQELANDQLPRLGPQRLGGLWILQQADYGGAEPLQVLRVVDQDAASLMLDLVFDPADTTRDDRASLPHRLGDGQAESLRKAFLNHNVGAALKGIDDCGVFFSVIHRELGNQDAVAYPRIEPVTDVPDLAQDLGLFRVVVDGGHGGPRENQPRIDVWRNVLREPASHAARVLQAVPARDLDHYAGVYRKRRGEVGPPAHSTRSAVVAEECRLAVGPAEDAARAKNLRYRVAVHVLVLGRERVDARRDDMDPRSIRSIPYVSLPRKDESRCVREVRREEPPRAADHIVRLVDPDMSP